jgi:hypothetical protein
MNLFSKERNIRIGISKELFNTNTDILDFFEPLKPSKKPLIVDEDCIINYIINTSNKDLSISVRVSALGELVESVRRAQITPIV